MESRLNGTEESPARVIVYVGRGDEDCAWGGEEIRLWRAVADQTVGDIGTPRHTQ